MSDHVVYSKEDQDKIDELNEEIHQLEVAQERLQRVIREIKAGQSPIKPGDVIQWESGSRLRRGVVKHVNASWKGFEYRVHILSKAGKHVGFANVSSDKFPTLVEEDAAEAGEAAGK